MNASGGSRRVIRRASHPRSARASTSPRLVPVPLVSVDAANYHVVAQHDVGGHVGGGESNRAPATTDAGEPHDPAGRDGLNRICDELPDAGAFDDHVRLEAHARDGACVVGRPQRSNEIRLGPRFDPVEDVDLEPVLLCDQGSKETDRSSTGDEHGPRLPEGTLTHRDNLLSRLRNNRRGLEQHAQNAE